MTSFEAGFLKYAEEYGLSPEEAAHTLKRASDYPGTQEMFKKLPEEAAQNENPEELDQLSDLLKQHEVDSHFQQIKL